MRADDKRVRQIFFNLLGNAIKFTRQGGVMLRVSHAREMADVEVHDSGPGMTAQEMERVFEPFVRGEAAAHAGGSAPVAAAAGGSGLGLTIAKMLTDLMGGELTVRSVPGEGTVFRVRLFLPELRLGDAADAGEASAVRAGADAVRYTQPGQRAGYEGARRRILVVDNEEADRGLLRSLLEPLGFEVREAVKGPRVAFVESVAQDGSGVREAFVCAVRLALRRFGPRDGAAIGAASQWRFMK